MTFAMTKRRAGAHHQELAQVAVAHLGDAPEPRFAAGRVLARRQAEEGGELAPAGEFACVLDRGHDCRGGDRADARMVINRLSMALCRSSLRSSGLRDSPDTLITADRLPLMPALPRRLGKAGQSVASR